MKSLLPLLPGLNLLPFPAYPQTAQTALSVSPGQIGYFASFFERIGSADVSTALLNNNEAAVQQFYDLTSAESTLLHSAAQTYRIK